MRTDFPAYAAMPVVPRPAKVCENRPFFIADPDGCWEWQGSKNQRGYGRVRVRGRQRLVHRLTLGEPPAPGLEADHLCRNPTCCRPDHLEYVTRAENLRRGVNASSRKTSCPRGHPYDVQRPKGWRGCRTCNNSLRRLRRKAARETKMAAAVCIQGSDIVT